MNLQPRVRKIVGQKEFLRNGVGTEYKTGGATLDADAFLAAEGFVTEEGYVRAGTAVYRDADTGYYVPWTDPATDATTGEPTEARAGAGLTANDVKITEGNAISGILLRGYPLESKCTGVTEGFKDEVKGYLRFDA